MELLMVNYKKVTLEEQMQLYEIIKGKRDLLKVNKDIEDVNYWAMKKKVDDLKIIFVVLQQNKENLQ